MKEKKMKRHNIPVLRLPLGNKAKLEWKQEADALAIQPVGAWPC